MNQEKLDHIRHSCAHMLAAAILDLYPGTKLGVGPTIENGFYYDFLFPEGVVVSENDLTTIEEKMKSIIGGNHSFIGKKVTAAEAEAEEQGQPFKLELIKEFAGEGKELTMYESGPFKDLCRGGHVENTSEIPVDGLKLDRVAGAYWRGSEKNPMLTRIYGLLFASKEELDSHLAMLEEAKKRDHRKIGAEQQLFFFDDLIGKGLVLWQPNGMVIRDEIEKFAKEMESAGGYVRVATPHLAKEETFLTSGHLPYYKDSMYPPMVMDDGTYYLKAMNCPHHHVIYRHVPKSYRELPVRLAEYGTCYRNELSGTLAGLLRVRALTMNDAHIYCRQDQIKEEFKKVLELTMQYFKIFGLTNYWFRLSKWSPEHLDKYINEPENWMLAETAIREVLQEMGVNFVEADDEAAFYGPKVDVQFKSVVGREETMSTVQLDFAARKRFGLKYTDQSGQENSDVFVIHRAPLSTHERFMAFLIEHYAGVWPVWLSPVQVLLAPVSSKHVDGARVLAKELVAAGIRIDIDEADETIGNKVRKAAGQKIPYIVVVGDKELGGEPWMIRVRGQKDQIKMTKEEFIEKVRGELLKRLANLS
jgi:threonyl-tRNA synthetase